MTFCKLAAATLALGGLMVGALLPACADQAGMAVVRRMAMRYQTVKTYADTWTITETQGGKSHTASGTVAVARPNRFYYSEARDGKPVGILAGDGRTTTLYMAPAKKYAQKPAASILIPDLQGTKHTVLGMLAGRDITQGVEDARIVGKAAMDGVPVQVIKVTPHPLLSPGVNPNDQFNGGGRIAPLTLPISGDTRTPAGTYQ